MPANKLVAYEYDIVLKFRLENIREFFEVSKDGGGPPDRETEGFGPDGAWRFTFKFCREDKDDYLQAWFRTFHGGFSNPITISLVAESLSGKTYLHETAAPQVYSPSHTAWGWSRLLSKSEDWVTNERLRHENAILFTLSVQTPQRRRAHSQETLSLLHRSLMCRKVDTTYVLFSRRDPSGKLTNPRKYFANDEATKEIYDSIVLRYESNATSKLFKLHESHADLPDTMQTEYLDLDSDFEDDEDTGDVEQEDSNTEAQHVEYDNQDDRAPTSVVRHSSRGFVFDNSSDTDDMMDIDNSDDEFVESTMLEVAPTDGKGIDLAHATDTPIKVVPASTTDFPKDYTVIVPCVASKTWEALIYYLYTGVLVFAPLVSEGEVRKQFVRNYIGSISDRPVPCSCKSMYRIAKEMELHEVQRLALNHLKSRLSAQNILIEVFSEFTSQHDEVRRMEIDILAQHWDVIKGTPAFRQKMLETTNGSCPHAGHIIAEIFQKVSMSVG